MLIGHHAYFMGSSRGPVYVSENGDIPLVTREAVDELVDRLGEKPDITVEDLTLREKPESKRTLKAELVIKYKGNRVDIELKNGCEERTYHGVTGNKEIPPYLGDRVVVRVTSPVKMETPWDRFRQDWGCGRYTIDTDTLQQFSQTLLTAYGG